ncbi:hypothetical protein AWH48_10955 [Domibacillus aminovorans]|uniref:Swarming motility protein SwrB n=1 Tax=Domibacillus aminovorans TaxID=29332 RepID=A0A177KK61_9BACI|nr:hypothetical protein [Domibacillus aminovorans]OAH53788.1 hypothetical protein AWH48_10955 [Domibacillus aminovorans]
MITFLITTSFLIHAVSLFALILLFQWQNNMKQTEKKMRQTAAETEEMMSVFLMELKEENEQLIKQLSKKEPKRKEAAPIPNEAPQDDTVVLPPIVPRAAVAKAYASVKKEPKQPVKERSASERMMELKKQGFSEEEIARELKIGVTEVQLGLKFYRLQ